MYGAGAGLLYAAFSSQTNSSLFGHGTGFGSTAQSSTGGVPFATELEMRAEFQKPNSQQTKYYGHEWLHWWNTVVINENGLTVDPNVATVSEYYTRKLHRDYIKRSTAWNNEDDEIFTDPAWSQAFTAEWKSGQLGIWLDGYGQHVSNQLEAKLIALTSPVSSQLLTALDYQNAVMIPAQNYLSTTYGPNLYQAYKIAKAKTKPNPAASQSYPTY